MSEGKATGLSPSIFSQMGKSLKLLEEIDWEKSALGPIKCWPTELHSAIKLCLSSSLPIAVWWTEDFIIFYNDAFQKLAGINHQSFGATGHHIGPDLWKGLASSLNIVVRNKTSHETQLQVGEDMPGRNLATFHSTPIYEGNDVRGVFTTVLVSPVARLQEETAGDREVLLDLACQSAGLGTWEYTPSSGKLVLSKRCREIFAFPEGKEMDFKTFVDRIHPEDKVFVEQEIANAMDFAYGGNYDSTYRILRFNNRSTRWIRVKGKVSFDAKNEVQRFIGVVTDITDEKLLTLRQKENELKLQLTLQSSKMGAFEWDLVTSTFLYTEKVAEIFGYSDAKNKKQSDFVARIHPEDLSIRLRAHQIAFQTGVLFYEVRVIWPDGSVHWVQLNGKTIFDKQGRPLRMYGTTLDITESRSLADALERKVRERTKLLEERNEQLKRSEERYVKMTEEVQDYAIILLDKDGTIINWNKGAEKIKGYRENEIIGQNFSIFYLEEDRKSGVPKSLIDRAVGEGRAMHEGWRKRKDGTRFWGSIVITALHDDHNNVIGFTKVTRDLTERKLAEDLTAQHTRELEIKNKQLEQFAYIASHDLQEPLRKIQTFVQVLEMKIDDLEARKKYFVKINSSAKRMSELIQAVLNYSRLSQSDELFVPVDLNTIVENVTMDYELVISEKQAEIKSDVLPVVKGIPLQLSQLFANLIGNSLKFSAGQPVITISAQKVPGKDLLHRFPSAGNAQSYLELAFADNGIGFEQRYADKIFTIFQRLHSRDSYAGTGIGLALCKRIVENHRGFIQAQGKLGKGATFIIYLPFE